MSHDAATKTVKVFLLQYYYTQKLYIKEINHIFAIAKTKAKDNIDILSLLNSPYKKNKNEIELKNKNDVIERKNQENHELEQEKEELELEKKQIIERNEDLKKELEEVYNSKRWRYMEKILGKKRK